MRIFARGSAITFTHTFYDSSGDATTPSTANVYLSFPGTGWPFRSTGMQSTSLGLTQDTTTLEWSGVWSSTSAQPGTVFWHIRSDSTNQSAADGEFTLRGNPANLSIKSS